MGIRETVNRNPGLVVGASVVVVVAAVVLIVMQLRTTKPANVTNQAYFTTDDGQTTFKADARDNDPPFKRDGQEAVRAYVYKCPGGQPWVAYLERYTPEALAIFAAARKANQPVIKSPDAVGKENVEVKKPGDKEWTKLSDDFQSKLKRVITVTCPDGTKKDLEMVY